ncbi:MAG TPA: PaaX family transcriptional regulator C-terminal domain-containing protein [Pseudonocardia sp.]|uniref:PaaX family transcriptional regulator n=1 Tax=Pseudonocardia sp. TaxID=60912 RepID=UPI002CC33149|nr:PaaX family transcriptional regulator C-terminal domain-containing protein [Pseudonocardia sp.]HTF50150.1 PaaX family transcriptional regulator C-terminal domain-containing protein [Pseudonocardia sp.]
MTSSFFDPVDSPLPGAAPPALSRRRELNTTSARSLLLTVLGEFVLPLREPVWTQVLLDVLGELGVEQKSGRQALARTAAEGLLSTDRAGRRVRWSLTETGQRLLSTGARRIYSFGASPAEWDGRWLVLLVSVPESRRQLRHRLRTRLAWAGMGTPAPGVWLSPDPGKQPEVSEVIAELALEEVSSSFVGPFGQIGEERELVAQAWNLAGVEAAYQDFIASFSAVEPITPGEILRDQINLVHSWRRFPFLDPQLPAELLPGGWAGAKAAELFHERHERWDGTARRHWRHLLDSAL